MPDKRDALILALLILLPVLSFSDLLFSDKTLYRLDISSIHYPLGVFKARVFSSGQLPLWNPHILFGFPQLADQDIVALNPLNLVFLLPIKPVLALSTFVVAHYILAGIFGYVMARSLRIGRVGAFITAVTFAFSGYLVAQVTNLPIVTGSVWLPLIFFLFVKALETMRPIYAVLCGGAIAVQILAAHPQVVFYSLFTLGAYGLFRLIRLWRDTEVDGREKRKRMTLLVTFLVIAVTVGLALAAVQIVPTWELKGLTGRATGLSYAMMTLFSLAPYNLLTFLFPNILGNPVIGYMGEGVFEELHAYAGIVPLLLIPWSWAKKVRDSHVAFFTILAGGSLLLALGHHTPLYDLLVHVPGFNFFRVPARWLYIVTFSLAVLAGYGFDALVTGRERGNGHFATFWKILCWANVGFSLMLLALLAFGQETVQRVNQLGRRLLSEHALGRTVILVQGLTRQPLIQVSDDLSTTLSSLNPVVPFVLLSNACFLLIYLWNKRKIRATLFQVVMAGLVVIDVLLVGGTTVNPVREGSYYEGPPRPMTFLRQNAGLHRIYPIIHRDDLSNLMEAVPAVHELYSVGGHVSELALARYETFVDALGQSPALRNLAGVKYLLVEKDSEYPGYTKVHARGRLEILENESVLPRAFVVHDVEVLASEQAVMGRMLGDDFDPLRTVILEEEPLHRPDQAFQPAEPDTHGAEITRYAPHEVVIEADLSDDGFLVLSDTHYPGWRVYVDGREDRIYQADYLFRAVFLEEGKHVVEFRYNPLSFLIGLAITLVTAAILCGLAVAVLLIRRRRRA
ncbi:YfhO family protein [Chloroflexota bacterium]